MNNEAYKNYFTKLGLLLAFLVIAFGILIYPAIFSRKAWQKNLKLCVEKVLDESEPSIWMIGNNKPLNNTFTTNAACYEVTNRKTGENCSSLIIRITTFYGPVAAVFLVDSEDQAKLVGFSSLHGRVSRSLYNNNYSKRIEFWESKIPEIIK